jgi:hypothetical protein
LNLLAHNLVISHSLSVKTKQLVLEHEVVPKYKCVGPILANLVLNLFTSFSNQFLVRIYWLSIDKAHVSQLVHCIHQLMVSLQIGTILSIKVGLIEFHLQKLELFVNLRSFQLTSVLLEDVFCHLIDVTTMSENK